MSVSDLKPDEYRRFLLSAAVEKGTKLKQNFAEALENLERLDRAEEFLKNLPAGQEELYGGDIAELCKEAESVFDRVKRSLLSAYLSFVEPDDMGGYVTKLEALSDEGQEKMFSCFDVKLAVFSDILLLKMPQLWSRYSTKMSGPTWGLPKDHLPWFSTELERVFQQHLDEIPSYLNRHFSYVHVLGMDQKQFPDNDNYDTKKVTDIVSEYMGGTDNALRTSFSFFSTRESILNQGSYLVVTNTFNNPPALSYLQQLLEQIFGSSTGRNQP